LCLNAALENVKAFMSNAKGLRMLILKFGGSEKMKKRIIVMLFAVCSMVGLANANLLTNGNFNTPDSTGAPDGWNIWTWAAAGQIIRMLPAKVMTVHGIWLSAVLVMLVQGFTKLLPVLRALNIR
jgi:phosphatidylserine synthase